MNDDRRPTDIPGYTILRALGRGGIATVYLAVQDRLARRVALKVMHPEAMIDDDFAVRFVEEGRIVARLAHPRIVTIHDLDSVGDLHYFSMEHLPGGNLAGAIKQGLTSERAVSITRQVAEALHCAHRHNVVHGDIKPRNILFRNDGAPVVTDFSIARIISESAVVTQLIQVGSPRYMAPEQSMELPTDHRVDLYSLGIVLYEMLTGEVPYDAGDVASLALKHRSAPIPVLRGALVRYQHILERLVAKRPEDRFDSAGQLFDALDRLAADRMPRTSDAATRLHPEDKVERTVLMHETRGADLPAGVACAANFAVKPATPVREKSDPAKARRRSGEHPPWLAIGLSVLAVVAALGGIWWFGAGTSLNLPLGTTPSQPPATARTSQPSRLLPQPPAGSASAPDQPQPTPQPTPQPASPPARATLQESERSLGLSRDRRRSVQRWLNVLGHDAGGADGLFGHRTRQAIEGLQTARDEAPTGYLTPALYAYLQTEGSRQQLERDRQSMSPEMREKLDKALADEAWAQVSFGYDYHRDEGASMDHAESLKWPLEAAEQGNAAAQTDLGIMYEKGAGVRKDHAEAVKWFRKAAEQGDPKGQYNLGFMYEKGRGVGMDHSEAVKWYREAAAGGSFPAGYRLKVMGH